jgi:hypothetical protein
VAAGTHSIRPSGPQAGRIAIAYERDAADVALYNQFGPPLFPAAMSVRVDPLAVAPG